MQRALGMNKHDNQGYTKARHLPKRPAFLFVIVLPILFPQKLLQGLVHLAVFMEPAVLAALASDLYFFVALGLD